MSVCYRECYYQQNFGGNTQTNVIIVALNCCTIPQRFNTFQIFVLEGRFDVCFTACVILVTKNYWSVSMWRACAC